MLGLRFCARAFSSCGKWGPLFIAVRGPLPVAAFLVAEHRLQTRRLSSCGSRTQLLRGMWDLPGPGLEPVSPALAGGFSTTAPPGKPFLGSYIRGLQALHGYFQSSHCVPCRHLTAHLLVYINTQKYTLCTVHCIYSVHCIFDAPEIYFNAFYYLSLYFKVLKWMYYPVVINPHAKMIYINSHMN